MTCNPGKASTEHMAVIERSRIIRSLPCRISEVEAKEASEQLAQETEEHERLLLQLKVDAREVNMRRKALRKSIVKLAKKVVSREEERQVECEVVRDFNSKEMYVVRTDTGEEIERTPMNRGEQRTIEGT